MFHRSWLIISMILFVFSSALADTSSGRITLKIDLSDHGAQHTGQVWIPYPITDTYQTISNISVSGTFDASGVYTDSVFETPMLYARWDKGNDKRTLVFTFDVTRQEVVRRNFPAAEAAWNPADFSKYLSATRLGPIDGEVKALADDITKGKHSVLDKAKALYDWVCENTYRNPDTRGCGFGDVYRLLKDPGGKCTDISSIFVALARAAGVPSREVFGIRQGKKPVEDITQWQHCWAEFYLPGYGWVPVDPADVRKAMLNEKLELSDPKTQKLKDYFWGGIDPYRIKLGEGRDLMLNPAQSGDPVNYLMYPFGQVGNETLDWLSPETFVYTITYAKD